MTSGAGDERTARRARLGESGANPFDGPRPRIIGDLNVRGDRSWTQLTGVVKNARAAGGEGIRKSLARVAGGQQTLAAGECP
jgi:hypothetical protein